jgi:hypothetical protein
MKTLLTIVNYRLQNMTYKDVNLFKLRSELKKWEKYQENNRPFIKSTK